MYKGSTFEGITQARLDSCKEKALDKLLCKQDYVKIGFSTKRGLGHENQCIEVN